MAGCRKFFRAQQTGDTIVEVLVCVAVIAVVLIGAYTVVNKAYVQLQDTQERSRAVKLAQTQIEDLRTNAVSNINCFNFSPPSTVTPVTGVNPNPLCVLNSDGTRDTTGTQPAYQVAITPNNPTPETYNVTVTWRGLRTMDTASLEYRLK